MERTHTRSSDCCDRPACVPRGSEKKKVYTSIRDRVLHKAANKRSRPCYRMRNFILDCRLVGVFVASAHLKGEEGHNNGHPANRHGDVSSPLLRDDVNGAKKEDRPDDVVEDDEAQKGHQDPQWDAHHLEHTWTFSFEIKRTLFSRTMTSTKNKDIFNKYVKKMEECSGFVPHQPRPVDDPVQPQSNEDELKNVH